MNAQYRFSFATGALLAVLGVFGPVDVAAQGTIIWGTQDNCVYQLQNGVWYRQDICRVMQGRAVYSTYRASTGQWLAYYDESEPGWVKARVLTEANAPLVAFPTASGRSVMVLVNNQWLDFATWQQRVNQGAQASRNGAANGILISEMERQQRAAEERRQAEARKAQDEAYAEKKWLDKYYEDKRHTADYYKRQQIERDRLAREANARAQANRDTQRVLDERAAARQREQRALDAQAADRRKAEQAAADRAAAERRVRNNG